MHFGHFRGTWWSCSYRLSYVVLLYVAAAIVTRIQLTLVIFRDLTTVANGIRENHTNDLMELQIG